MSYAKQLKELRVDLKTAISDAEKLRVRLDQEPDFRTEDNVAKFDDAVSTVKSTQKQFGDIKTLDNADKFLNEPEGEPKSRGFAPGYQTPKSAGQALIESDDFKALAEMSKSQRGRFSKSIEVPGMIPSQAKATFTEATATLTGYQRPPGIYELGQQMPMIADLFAQGETNQPTIRYQQEDTYTNAADSVAEGAAIPEATFDTSEVDAAVRKIGARGRVSSEIFDDFPQVRDYVQNRLVFMTRQAIDTQVYGGSGTPPDIDGILNVSGIQTTALATTAVEAIHNAITKIRSVAFFEPDAMVLHPNDWEAIRLSKDDNNNYYGGGPFGSLEQNRLWGVPVVVTALATENTGLVGAFRLGAQVFYRDGIEVEMANQNEDDFNKDLISIRVTQRLALPVYRPLAFCTVTGI